MRHRQVVSDEHVATGLPTHTAASCSITVYKLGNQRHTEILARQYAVLLACPIAPLPGTINSVPLTRYPVPQLCGQEQAPSHVSVVVPKGG